MVNEIAKHQSEPQGRIWRICSLHRARERGRSPRRVWHGNRAGVSPSKLRNSTWCGYNYHLQINLSVVCPSAVVEYLEVVKIVNPKYSLIYTVPVYKGMCSAKRTFTWIITILLKFTSLQSLKRKFLLWKNCRFLNLCNWLRHRLNP